MLTSAFAFRVAALMVSGLAHVLLYGALSLAPAWSPPPRTGLLITDLLVTEPPAPVVPTPQLVTPPRPVVRPTPPKRPIETAPPQSPAASGEPPIERDVSEPPMVAAPPTVAAAWPAGTLPSATSSVTTLSQSGAGLAVAALPSAPPAAAPAAVTRTAIPRGGYQITPSYPATARQLGVEGTALLSVFVDADGRVAQVVVRQSAGHPDLDRAAADAVRRWRFEPARRGAEAVEMLV